MSTFLLALFLLFHRGHFMKPGTEFTYQEIFQALRWGEDEESARRGALLLSGALDEGVVENDSTSVGYSNFSEDFLVLLSLVSEEARAKAEQRIADKHGGSLTDAEREAWEKRRRQLRAGLERSGKLKD